MTLFDIYKDRINKLKKVKHLKEIKAEFVEDKDDKVKLEKLIDENNKLLKEVLNNFIIADLINWCENNINNNNSDTIKKLAEWLNTWTLYLHLEKGFDSSKNRKYNRGDIVHVNFGFNVGSELGGSHYGIIIEKSNDKSNETVIVVPLRSEDGNLEGEEVIKKLNKHEVYLGRNLIPIGEAKNNHSIAKLNQIRSICKLRITAPKKENDTVYPLEQDIRNKILDIIDGGIKNMILK